MPACILIIEDDSFSRDSVRFLLGKVGYSVLLAEDGDVGLRLALDAKPDLIICDLQMPVMSGYEVVRALHQQADWRRIPVVAVTSSSEHSDREKVLEAGFDGHIGKPITPVNFVAQIEAFLPASLKTQRR
ncbi:MAG: response regulator [Pseudomonadota bacterium]